MKTKLLVAMILAAAALYSQIGDGGGVTQYPTSGGSGSAAANWISSPTVFTGTQTLTFTPSPAMNTHYPGIHCFDGSNNDVTSGVAIATPTVNTFTVTATSTTLTCSANTSGVTGATGPAGPSGATGSSGGPVGPTGGTGPAGQGSVVCSDATGSTTNYTCPGASFSSLTTGAQVLFVPQASSSGASTLAVGSTAAKSVVWPQSAAAVIQDDLLAGGQYTVTYNGTNWVLTNGPDGSWQGFSYANGWANFGAPFTLGQFMKDRMGIVHLRGLISGGTGSSGTTLLTLPVGYRPTTQMLAGAFWSNTLIVRLDLGTTGTVVLGADVNSYVSMEDITFATH